MNIDHSFRNRIFVLALLLASMVFPHCAARRSAITIIGRVTDAVTRQPIDRVTIWDQCREVTTTTNATGDYQFIAASTCHGTSTAIALTYSKPGYRLVYRPSFEQRPEDTAAFYTASRTVNVAMSPYKADYVGEVLRSFAVITPGTSELDAVAFSAGTFQQGDILFVDAVSLDSGEDDASFTATLRGPGLQPVELMTSRSRQGHGGHVQFYGEFSNPSGTSTISGLWHFPFTHSAWPGQSISLDKKLNTNTSQNNWIVGPFTVALRDNTGPAGPNHPHWIEWQVVRLRKNGKGAPVTAEQILATKWATMDKYDLNRDGVGDYIVSGPHEVCGAQNCPYQAFISRGNVYTQVDLESCGTGVWTDGTVTNGYLDILCSFYMPPASGGQMRGKWRSGKYVFEAVADEKARGSTRAPERSSSDEKTVPVPAGTREAIHKAVTEYVDRERSIANASPCGAPPKAGGAVARVKELKRISLPRLERVLGRGRDTAVVFTNGGRIAAAGDNGVMLLDPATGATIRTLTKEPVPAAIATVRDLVAVGGGFIRVWNVETGAEIHRFRVGSSTVRAVAFIADGRQVVSGDSDSTVRIWDLGSGREIGTLVTEGPIGALEITRDQQFVLIGGFRSSAAVFDVAKKHRLLRFANHGWGPRALKVMADGTLVLSGGDDARVRLWRVRDGMEVRCFQGHTGVVLAVAVVPSVNLAVSTSLDKTIRFWDLRTGEQVAQLGPFEEWFESLAVSPDGQRLVGAGYDTIRVWSVSR